MASLCAVAVLLWAWWWRAWVAVRSLSQVMRFGRARVRQQGQSYVEKQDDKTVKEWMKQQARGIFLMALLHPSRSLARLVSVSSLVIT